MKSLKKCILKGVALAAALSLFAFFGCKNETSNDDSTDESVRTGWETVSSTVSSESKGNVFGYVLNTNGTPIVGASISLGTQTVKTNADGSFLLTGIPVTDQNTSTYSVTITADGYLPHVASGIQVLETTDKNDTTTLLENLRKDYAAILTAYAGNASAGSAIAVSEGGSLTNIGDSKAMTTVAKAIEELEAAYARSEKTYEATFVAATMIPLNASLSGKISLTSANKALTTVETGTLTPAPKDTVVRVTYTDGANTNDYTWEAKTDAEGKFSFTKLPASKKLTVIVEGFEAEVGGNTYFYSTDSYAMLTQDTAILAAGTSRDNTVTINNESSAVTAFDMLLYAQPKKIWVTETNAHASTAAAPLALNTPITFTFNKAMESAVVTSTASAAGTTPAAVALADAFKYTWNTEKTKLTVEPEDGYWTASGNYVNFTLSGKATDGAVDFVTKSFNTYIDNIIDVTPAYPTVDSVVTFTFDREIKNTDAVKVANDKSEELVTSWDSANKVLTVTAKNGKFKNSGEHKFTISNVEAVDGSTNMKTFGLVANGAASYEYKINVDRSIFVTFANISDTTKDAITITFSRKITDAKVKAEVGTKEYGVTTAWNTEKTILTVTARDTLFDTAGKYTFTLYDVVAEDKATMLKKSVTDTEAATLTYEQKFEGFKVTSVEVVDTIPTTATLVRTALTTAQTLKITFTKNVRTAAFTVNSNTADNYIDGNVVYVALNDSTVATLTLAGTATSENGTILTAGTDFTVADYVVGSAYQIVDSSLYAKALAISGNNDVTVKAIKPEDAITLTFNKDIPTDATLSAELYDTTDTTELTATKYKATAAASGAKVTITVDSTNPLKAKDSAENVYYLSLKAVAKDGKTVLFSTASKSFGSVSGSYEEKIAEKTNASKKYIKVTIVQTKVLTGDTLKTTTKDDFAKSFNSPIVLQFTHSVKDYKAYLFKSGLGTAVYGGDYADVDKKNLYASSTTFDTTGEVMTVTPTGYYPANTTIVPVVYDKDGKALSLTTLPTYTSKKEAKTGELITELLKGEKKISNFKQVTTAVDNGSTVTLTFDAQLNKESTTFPTYKLYKQTCDALHTDVTKADYGTPVVIPVVTSDGKTMTVEDVLLRKEKTAYIKPTLGISDFNYGKVRYVVYAEIDNVPAVSGYIELSDNQSPDLTLVTPVTGLTISGVSSKYNLTGANTSTLTSAPAIEFTLYAKSTEYLCSKAIETTLQSIGGTQGSATITSAWTTTSIGGNTVTALKVTVASGAKFFKGDTITITVKDAADNPGTVKITISD